MIEQELLELIQNSIITDAVKLDEHHEADFYSEKFDLYGELKCVNGWYPRLMIEKKKYDELMLLPGKKRYICSTTRGVYSWDLNKIVIPDDWWKDEYVKNYSTYFYREYLNGPSTKIMAKIPIGWSKDITKLINYPV